MRHSLNEFGTAVLKEKSLGWKVIPGQAASHALAIGDAFVEPVADDYGVAMALARIAKGVAVGIVSAPAMVAGAPVVKIQQRLSGDARAIRGVDGLFGVATKHEAVNREFLEEN